MPRLVPLALILCIAATASAESIWLRGRGDDVWIERDGAVESRSRDAAAASEEAPASEDVRPGVTRVATSPDPAIARAYHSQQARREAYERSLAEPRGPVLYVVPSVSYGDAYPSPPTVDRPPEVSYPSPAYYGYPYSPRYHYPYRYYRYYRHDGHHGFGRDRHFGRHRDPVIRIPSAVSFGGEDGGFVTRGGAYRRR